MLGFQSALVMVSKEDILINGHEPSGAHGSLNVVHGSTEEPNVPEVILGDGGDWDIRIFCTGLAVVGHGSHNIGHVIKEPECGKAVVPLGHNQLICAIRDHRHLSRTKSYMA